MGQVVVLAYSGGLDTSAIVPWLKEVHGVDVLCFAANVGQGELDVRGLKDKARRAGAIDCVVADLRETFVRDFVFPTLQSGAVYSRTYLLGTAMARPAIAAAQVQAARAAGATALAHGCTGKGNDQIRFELTYMAAAPEMQIIAPWREWSFKGREDLIKYVAEKGLELEVSEAKLFSRDRNLWHCSHEGGVLEDPSVEPPADMFVLTTDPMSAPDAPEEISIEFDEGIPVAVNGVPLGPVALLERLNEIAGLHGIGRVDVVEDRLVGMKSRGVYETPGGTVLRMAHRELEMLVLDKRTLSLKDEVAPRYADLVYEGRWWTQEREALDALTTSTQRVVTGEIRVRLYKGAMSLVSRRSPFALYSPGHASFEADTVYNQADAAGFVRLFGLPQRIAAERRAHNNVAEVGIHRS